MPTIESWDKLPANVRQHLVDRMRERPPILHTGGIVISQYVPSFAAFTAAATRST
jgi:hypothetical protein